MIFSRSELFIPRMVPSRLGIDLKNQMCSDRRRQVDVAHALAPHAAVRHLDAAPVADDPLELRAFVLAASAFPIALRSEYPLTEQTVLFRPVRPVIDRLGLSHLSKGPAPNVIRAGQGDLDRTIIVNSIVDISQHVKPPYGLLTRPSIYRAVRPRRFFSSWIFKPSPRISLHSTSKDSGVPASSVFWPLTIDS